MKNKYIFIGLLFSIFGKAQVLEKDNYNSYNIGNVGSFVFNGHTFPGVGGMFTSYYSGTIPLDFQIVSIDNMHDKSLKITSGETQFKNDDNRRFVWKSEFRSKWDARIAGNNILKVTLEIFTGDCKGENVNLGSEVQESNGYVSLGRLVGISYNTSTQKFQVGALLTKENEYGNGGTVFRYINVPSPTIPANTWVSVGYTYNKVTGDITYSINGISSTLVVKGYYVKNWYTPNQHVIFSTPPMESTNVATTFAVDNYIVEAVSTSLSSTEIANYSSVVDVFPNPTKGIFHINSKTKEDVFIYNSSGQFLRKETVKTGDNIIDISAFSNGVYFIQKGNEKHKLIKE